MSRLTPPHRSRSSVATLTFAVIATELARGDSGLADKLVQNWKISVLIGALAPLAGTVTAVIVLGALIARILAVHAARPALAGPLLAEAALVLGLGLLVGGLATLPKGAGWNGGEP